MSLGLCLPTGSLPRGDLALIVVSSESACVFLGSLSVDVWL
jgi:hypothetical protein